MDSPFFISLSLSFYLYLSIILLLFQVDARAGRTRYLGADHDADARRCGRRSVAARDDESRTGGRTVQSRRRATCAERYAA